MLCANCLYNFDKTPLDFRLRELFSHRPIMKFAQRSWHHAISITYMRTMVLEYARTKFNQFCRFLYTSTMVRIWVVYT